ncbi:hypothetical protein M422DRAFT_61957 [Sphaerobolus stellatus SS14]|uniref:CxC2-like cysteine cluster KDZ transposase-associated domain-containing protein n=1 Tax=Sphaerobolus stellatus (strain SS14) TaxID=990650 RepID=A0A0C9TFD8_SPHS4|nr:hypothetical protein M422DRAFT_61957 [Sphaerobolus stellatus SS14]
MPVSRVAREWIHLKMLKRAGRANTNTGAEGTKEGELALMCSACPQPKWNLPDRWKTDKEKGLLKDGGLGAGWAYMVEPLQYQIKVCTCHALKVVLLQEGHEASGQNTSGVGGCICARHGLFRPNSVGDLQLGEKYKNMDYILFSCLKDEEYQKVDISYDVSCIWHKRLNERMELLPENLRTAAKHGSIRVLIPKFHLAAHMIECQKTDGEEIERVWSVHNDIGKCTKEMGPGNRWDTLDAFFGDWNWRKYVKLGLYLHNLLREAIDEAPLHQDTFDNLTATLMKDEVVA